MTAMLWCLLFMLVDGVSGRVPLLALRGGARTSYSNSRPIVSRSWEDGGNIELQQTAIPVSQSTGTSNDDMMSDAERVYVLQQFAQPAIRLTFLRKVYSIVAVQLAVTAAIVAALRMHPAFLHTVVRRLGQGLFFLPMLPVLLLSLLERERTSGSRLAYFLLAVFTAFEGLAVGVVSSQFPLALVLRAVFATSAATIGLSAYALTTKRDFTVYGGLLSSCVTGVFVLSLLQLFMGGSMLHSLHAGFGTLLFCVYLVFNTQAMMGGKKERQLRPTEHIMGAVQIYTDIMGLFMHVLQSMARAERD
jgi:FtsH-binding integral membrane protein